MRLKLAYYASLALLLALVGLTARPWVTASDAPQATSKTQRGTIQELPDHYLVSYDIVNDQEDSVEYVVIVASGGRELAQNNVTVNPRAHLGYYFHVQPEQLNAGPVTLTLYRDGRAQPLDQVTYHLSPIADGNGPSRGQS